MKPEDFEKLAGRVRVLLSTDVVKMTELWLEYPAGRFPPPFAMLREEHLTPGQGQTCRRWHFFKLEASSDLRDRGKRDGQEY
jgi:hypothetical protein